MLNNPRARARAAAAEPTQPPCAHALCSALPPSRDGAAKRQRTQRGRRKAAALHTSRSRKQVGANGIGMGAGGGEAGQRAPWRSGGGYVTPLPAAAQEAAHCEGGQEELTRALFTTESEQLHRWRGASAAAAAGQQREGLERGERLQRRLLGRHVEVGAAAQARGLCRLQRWSRT